jgi:hypothetical protein
MTKVLVAPNDKLIRGTIEILKGCAGILGAKEGQGDGARFELDYGGTTDVWWDESKTETDENGERLFLDEEGDEWAESQLRLVDESELEDNDA